MQFDTVTDLIRVTQDPKCNDGAVMLTCATVTVPSRYRYDPYTIKPAATAYAPRTLEGAVKSKTIPYEKFTSRKVPNWHLKPVETLAVGRVPYSATEELILQALWNAAGVAAIAARPCLRGHRRARKNNEARPKTGLWSWMSSSRTSRRC
jgi:hypothetical protein